MNKVKRSASINRKAIIESFMIKYYECRWDLDRTIKELDKIYSTPAAPERSKEEIKTPEQICKEIFGDDTNTNRVALMTTPMNNLYVCMRAYASQFHPDQDRAEVERPSLTMQQVSDLFDKHSLKDPMWQPLMSSTEFVRALKDIITLTP